MQIFVFFKLCCMQIFNLTSKMTLKMQRMRFGSQLNVRQGKKKCATFSKCVVSHCAMAQRIHLTPSEAWRTVGLLEGGQIQAEVATSIGVAQSAGLPTHFSRRKGGKEDHL